MRTPARNSVSFFKVFNKERSSDKLKIPPACSLHMRETLPCEVFLGDQYGNNWPVKLANTENQLHFGEGWAKFVEDNSIEDGDFLFFQYHDDKVIQVILTGRNACNKKGVGACKSNEREEEHMEAETIDVEMDEVNDMEMEDQESEPIGEQVDEEEQEGYDEELNELEDERLRKQVKREIEKLRKEVQNLAKKVGDPESKDANGSLRKSNRIKNLAVQKPAGAKRGRRKNPDYYGAEIFKSGILPRPQNPYFVTGIRPKRREELYIPIEVLKDTGIKELPMTATLRDSSGRTWPTYRTKWGDGRKFYIGGWASFCRMNFVGENDLCVCEFIKGTNKNDLILQLQVVPTSNNANLRRDQKTA